jgi:hypothetical protein
MTRISSEGETDTAAAPARPRIEWEDGDASSSDEDPETDKEVPEEPLGNLRPRRTPEATEATNPVWLLQSMSCIRELGRPDRSSTIKAPKVTWCHACLEDAEQGPSKVGDTGDGVETRCVFKGMRMLEHKEGKVEGWTTSYMHGKPPRKLRFRKEFKPSAPKSYQVTTLKVWCT